MSAPSSLASARTPIEPRRAPPLDAGERVTHAVHANAQRRLDVAAATSCGRLHDLNEDAHSDLAQGSGALFVVADGVGGGAMAQLASRLLVACLHEALDAALLDGASSVPAQRVAALAAAPARQALRAAILDADRAIAASISRTTDLPGAATCALAAPLDDAASRWLVGWVGDCRAWRWSPRAPRRLERLTRDDTFAELGERVPAGGAPGDPARMVGNGATDGGNAVVVALGAGELLLLGSDGVWKSLRDADWCALLAAPAPLERRLEAIVATARGRGSVDDATLLAIERSRVDGAGGDGR